MSGLPQRPEDRWETVQRLSGRKIPEAMNELAELLPDEDAVRRIPQILEEQEKEMIILQERIDVVEAELKRNDSAKQMKDLQTEIQTLTSQIQSIQVKSTQAEKVVKTITQEIARLDRGKKNVGLVLMLRGRWRMFKQSLDRLRGFVREKEYAGMGGCIGALTNLATSLQVLIVNPPVALAFKEFSDLQGQVKELVAKEVDSFLEREGRGGEGVIKDVCEVVEVLGKDFKSHIIERYVSAELKEYRRIFAPFSEAGHLDNTARRYAWFRRVLKYHDDERSGLFPGNWEIDRLLVARFSEGTRIDLRNILNKERPDVAVLLDAWQATMDWEDQMSKRFERTISAVLKNLPSGADAIPISEAFADSMKIFVDAQDRALNDMLSAYRGTKSRSSFEGEGQEQSVHVLSSSTELFYFYAQILEQCRKYSTGQGMKDLAAVFAKWLRIYSDDVLIASMKKPESRQSMDGRPNIQEIKNACLALNTADYCLTTSSQLEEKLKGVIDEDLREGVSFQPERDLFFGVISACLMTILRELEQACEPAFNAILRTQWSSVENVSGRSAYVSDLVGCIKSVAEVVRERVEQKKYVRSFADKAVGVVIMRYTAAVTKSRPLKKVGAEQVLLDVQAIKGCLLDVPEAHTSTTANAYSRLVQKTTGQLETMLKVVLVPEDPPEGFVQNYCLLIGDKSFSNFQKILDLKGTPRLDQQNLLDIFLSVTSSNQDLTDTSFLTTLDMDPDNKSAAAASMVNRDNTRSPIGTTVLRSDTPKGFGDFKKLVSFALHGQMSI